MAAAAVAIMSCGGLKLGKFADLVTGCVQIEFRLGRLGQSMLISQLVPHRAAERGVEGSWGS